MSSPLAALQVVRASRSAYPAIRLHGPTAFQASSDWPVAARLASLESGLRARLDARIGWRRPGQWWMWSDVGSVSMYTPHDALLSGVSDRAVFQVTVGDSLHGTLTSAVAAPLRAALASAVPGSGSRNDRVDASSGVIAWHGQHDAPWVAYYDIRRQAGLGAYASGDLRQLELWAALARSTGWWWPGEGICVMAERPVEVHAEPLVGSHHGELRLHRDDGPAIAFGDGFAVHVLHGTPVPEWVIAGPTVDLIQREPNVEVRRSAIERLGWDAYLRDAGLVHVATCPDPGNPGAKLSLYEDQTGSGASHAMHGRVLVVINGTPEPDGHRRRYGINVPPTLEDPVDAAAWTYGLTGAQYAGLARRT